MTTLVIADDHEVLREALSRGVAKRAGFEVVGSVGDAQGAVRACARAQPDVLIMDIEMPGRDALAAIKDIKAVSPKTKVVILTAHCRDVFIDLAISNGVAGYLLKSASSSAIADALMRIAKGEVVFAKPVLSRMSQDDSGRTGRSERSTRLSKLTPREFEVLRYIGKGLDNEQMARAMSLSKRTVERHLARLKESIGIRDRPALQNFAQEQQLSAD